MLLQQRASFVVLSLLPLQHLELQDAAAAAAAAAPDASVDADVLLQRLQHSSSAVLLLHKRQQQLLLSLADPLQQLTQAVGITQEVRDSKRQRKRQKERQKATAEYTAFSLAPSFLVPLGPLLSAYCPSVPSRYLGFRV